MKKALIALALILAFAVGALADRVVTYTLVSATRANIIELSIARDNGSVMASARYEILDSEGTVRLENRVVDVPLTQNQVNQLTAFLDNVIVPAINAEENL